MNKIIISLIVLVCTYITSCKHYEKTEILEIPEKEPKLSLEVNAANAVQDKIPIEIVLNKDADLTYNLKEGKGYIIINKKPITDSIYTFKVKKGVNIISYVPTSYDLTKMIFRAAADEEQIQKNLTILAQDVDFGWELILNYVARNTVLYRRVNINFQILGPQKTYLYKVETDKNNIIRRFMNIGNDMLRKGTTVYPDIFYETLENHKGIMLYMFPMETGMHSIKVSAIDSLGNAISKKILIYVDYIEIDNALDLNISSLDNKLPSENSDPYIYHLVDSEIANSTKKALKYGISLKQMGNNVPYIPNERYYVTIEPDQDTDLPKDFFKVSINKSIVDPDCPNSINYDLFAFANEKDRNDAFYVEVKTPEKYIEMNKKVKVQLSLKSLETGTTYKIPQTLRIQIDKRK